VTDERTLEDLIDQLRNTHDRSPIEDSICTGLVMLGLVTATPYRVDLAKALAPVIDSLPSFQAGLSQPVCLTDPKATVSRLH